MTRPAESPAFEGIGLTKSYGPVKACTDVSLKAFPGKLTALVGDNGAGKSTLAKMLTGAILPESGTLRVKGAEVQFASPIDARKAGVEAVYQELALAPNLDVVQNIFLGREVTRRVFGVPGLRRLDETKMTRVAREHMTDLNVSIPNLRRLPIGSMSGGQRQTVAIARAIFWASDVLIMDEPTAALGVRESAAVLQLVREALSRSISVIMISHAMPQVVDLADSVVVMRQGHKVAEFSRGEFDVDLLVRTIVGVA